MGEKLAEQTAHILVVEDEKEIRELMALHLLRQGYKVKECSSAEEAMSASRESSFQMFVLDWMLPGMSGIDIIEHLKKSHPHASVLMVTANAEPQDIVTGLEKGADDYLTKPFEPSVFMARVKALLRRAQQNAAPRSDSQEEVRVGSLYINFRTYDVVVDNEKLHLTPSEFKLLSSMVQNQGKVLTRDHLIEHIQGEGVNVVGRTIDTHVFGLRKKLGVWGDNIETIRGVGYRVRAES